MESTVLLSIALTIFCERSRLFRIPMSQILWLTAAWVAGTAAILGSLMVLGSLILLAAPTQPRSRKPPQATPASVSQKHRLTLLVVSLAIALAGLGILFVVPFPTF